MQTFLPPVPLPFRKALVVLALPLVLLLATATARADEAPGGDGNGNRGDNPGWRSTVSLVDQSSLLTDADTGGGDGGSLLGVDSYGAMTFTFDSPAVSWSVGLFSRFALRDIDAATTVLGGDQLDLLALGITGWVATPLSDGTSLVLGGGAQVSCDIDAPVFRDTISGWAFAAVGFSPAPGLSLRLGVHVFLSLRQTGLWPLIFADWRFAEHWRLRTDGWSIELATEAAPEFWLGLSGGYQSAEYRLTDSFAPAPTGIWFEHRGRIALTAEVAMGVLTARIEAGATVFHEVRTFDNDGDRIDIVRVKPGAFVMLHLELTIR